MGLLNKNKTNYKMEGDMPMEFDERPMEMDGDYDKDMGDWDGEKDMDKGGMGMITPLTPPCGPTPPWLRSTATSCSPPLPSSPTSPPWSPRTQCSRRPSWCP